MPIFKYKALDRNKQVQAGMVEASNKEYVGEILAEKGLSIVSITKAGSGQPISLGFLNRVKAKDIVVFSRQFSVLISANVAMV